MNAIHENPAADARLVQRLQLRDKDALADLVDRHGSKMYGIAFRMVHDETAAQEILQDTLILVWNKIDSYQGHAQFTTWLYRVTANAGLMHLRKARSAGRFLEPGDISTLTHLVERDDDERPDVAVLRGELREQVQNAIAALPEPFRTTVVLADVEGLSMAAIAELNGLSIAAVKSRLHRARLQLRKQLLPYLKADRRLPGRAISFGALSGACLGEALPVLEMSV